MCGYTTLSTALAAMAASTAEPPAFRTSTPASDASACGDDTIPRNPSVSGRPVSSAPSSKRELHPVLSPPVPVIVGNLLESATLVEVDRHRHRALRVEANHPETEGASVLEAPAHQAAPETESLAALPNPHPLDLAHAGFERPHPGSADDRSVRGLAADHHPWRAVVLDLPVRDVVVEVVAVEVFADVGEVCGQLARHRIAIARLDRADEIAVSGAHVGRPGRLAKTIASCDG